MKNPWTSRKLILFSLILLTAFILRVFMLGEVPAGLTNDEADIGYDAYSMTKTGKDQWGEFLPFTSFKGFGDYRLPLYTYLTVPSVALFDLNSFAVRLPSALFGIVSVFLIFFVTRRIVGKSEIPVDLISFSAMSLMAISPWAVGLSRIGIESNVAIAFFLGALLLFLKAIDNPKLFIFSFALFALTIYTYTSYTLFAPLTILVLLFYFRKKLRTYKKHILFSLILFTLLISPLFVFRSAAGVRASQVTFINSQDNIGLSADLNDRRGSCIEVFPSIICKVFENKFIVIGNTFVGNYVNHFSPDFLYLNGTTTQFSILPQRSLLFTVELFILIVGFIAILKRKVRNGLLLIILATISPIPDTLTGDGHFSRAANMQPFIFLIEGVGVSFMYSSIKSKRIKYFSLSVIYIVLITSCVAFLLSYFSYFPKHYSKYGQYGYEELVSKLTQKQTEYNRIYISKFSNDTKQYVYFLFYNKYDPISFQNKKNVKYSNDNGWVSIDKLENIYFVDRLPTEKEMSKMSSEKVLLVSHPNEFPKDYEFTESIVDKNNNEIFTFVNLSDYLQYLENQKVLRQEL